MVANAVGTANEGVMSAYAIAGNGVPHTSWQSHAGGTWATGGVFAGTPVALTWPTVQLLANLTGA